MSTTQDKSLFLGMYIYIYIVKGPIRNNTRYVKPRPSKISGLTVKATLSVHIISALQWLSSCRHTENNPRVLEWLISLCMHGSLDHECDSDSGSFLSNAGNYFQLWSQDNLQLEETCCLFDSSQVHLTFFIYFTCVRLLLHPNVLFYSVFSRRSDILSLFKIVTNTESAIFFNATRTTRPCKLNPNRFFIRTIAASSHLDSNRNLDWTLIQKHTQRLNGSETLPHGSDLHTLGQRSAVCPFLSVFVLVASIN